MGWIVSIDQDRNLCEELALSIDAIGLRAAR